MQNSQYIHARGGETRKTPSAQPERTSQRLIQSIYKEGGSHLTHANAKHPTIKLWFYAEVQSIYKGAIVFPTRLDHNATAKTDGNVYNPNSSLLKDAKRKNNGSPKKTRSQTRFTRLFAQETRQTPTRPNPLLAKNNRGRT